MTRTFRRGELRSAVLRAVAEVGPATGYVVMQHLAETVGPGWRPSPGAIYPALLALDEAGLITTSGPEDGPRCYAVTDAGRRACTERPSAALARRPDAAAPAPRLGDLLDAFARDVPHRSTRLDPERRAAVASALDLTRRHLAEILDPRETR